MPLKDLQVIMASNVSGEDQERIRKAFFPQLSNIHNLNEILFRPWEDPSTGVNLKGINGYARMPYNFVANTEISSCVGTQALPKGQCDLWKLEGRWKMWQTASRSCVIELDSIGGPEERPANQNIQDTYDQGMTKEQNKDIQTLPWPWLERDDVLKSDSKNVFKLKSMYDDKSTSPKYFSIKTGMYPDNPFDVML
jgi:hypothetical protein